MRAMVGRAVVGVVAMTLVLGGCSQVSTKSFRLLGTPEAAPSDPAKVEILTRPPLRRHVELGRIDAVPHGDVDNAKIEDAIRNEAAKMGADAVIINFQGEVPTGFAISGFPGSAEAHREVGRVVKATAIKYEGHGFRELLNQNR